MKLSWTQGLDKQEELDLLASFRGSLLVRKRLAKLLQEKVEASAKTARSKLGYDNPNWTYLQADQRGYERALLEVVDLILDDRKENT